ncbi:hypothetical protein D3C83_38520 [compost metagenome]
MAVDDVDEPPGIDFHVVGLRTRLAAARLRDEPRHFLRSKRIADVDHPQPAGKPCAADERAFDVFLKLVRPEAAAVARPRGIEFAHLKVAERLDAREIAHVE